MIGIGEIVCERYVVEALLGSGGLADVYKVRHITLGSVHALKLLTWDRASVDRRLLLEGRIQAQLRHPNVVAVSDVMRVNGRAALLLEYVDGPTLDTYLDSKPADLDAIELFSGIMAAVVRAHDAGVLHRDLKPQNILLETSADRIVAKVTDFGLAKVVQDEMAASKTRNNVTMGTPGYMAPEQVRDAASVDARTDVFALGAILHELLTGRPAFADDEGFISVTSTLERTPPPLPESVPAHLRNAVSKALSPDSKDRPADARALAELVFLPDDPRRRDVLVLSGTPLALEPRGSDLPTWSSPPTSGSVDSSPTMIPPPTPPTPPPRGAPIIAAIALLALTLAAGTVWVVQRGNDAVSDAGTAAVAPAPPAPPVAPQVPTPPPDAGTPDAGTPDAGTPDAGTPEAGTPDAAAPDAATPDDPAPQVAAAPKPRPAAPAPPDAPLIPPPEPAGPVPTPQPSGDDGVAQVEAPASPAPVPAPEPPAPASDPEADQAAMMAEMTRLLVGTWTGTSDGGKPFQLRIDKLEPEAVRGDLVFPGPTPRIIQLTGRYVDGTLALASSDGGTVLNARIRGNTLTGAYGKGKRMVDFTAQR